MLLGVKIIPPAVLLEPCVARVCRRDAAADAVTVKRWTDTLLSTGSAFARLGLGDGGLRFDDG